MFVLMETREDFLLKLATVLDDVGSNQKLIIRDRYIERAFGGTRAIAIAEAEVFARAHGCTFRYNRIKRQGEFTRAYPAGGRA
ncbi:glutathione synthase/RimK-type ligase-like ATP-grasp enzyme [Bradyrhizobium sp. S3.9.2]|uniref:hypothetical protein n=1 Tax=Bradyrhizobium sp. S3.9.2 TaxID=3156432 RepID=UPI003394C9A5